MNHDVIGHAESEVEHQGATSARLLEAAKFEPPSVDRTVHRPELAAAVRSGHPAILWLQGTSGSGKSTLVAQALKDCAGSSLWYRLDERDNDPAFFFANWSALLRVRFDLQSGLPHFSDSARGRESEFMQRLLAAAAPCLPRSLIIVFDDAEQLQSARMHAAITCIAAREERRLVVISRLPPPSSITALVASGDCALCHLDLSFSAQDCVRLATAQQVKLHSGEDLRSLTGGHAASLVLACEFMRSTQSRESVASAGAAGAHGFLLARLLEVLPPAQRELLLRCCWLPTLEPALVAKVLEAADAEQVRATLDALADRGLLIRHRLPATVAFLPHDLVASGSQTLSRQLGYGSFAERCAQVLQEHGCYREAFALWADLERTQQAVQVLERLAQNFAKARQSDLLLAAVSRVPRSTVEPQPGLCFWIGQALLGVDELEARAWFCKAYAAASVGSELRLLAAACVVFSYLQCARGLSDRLLWAERFQVECERVKPTIYSQLVPLAQICARYFLAPGAVDCQRAEQALREILPVLQDGDAWPSPHFQLGAALVLVDYVNGFHDSEQARQLALMTEKLAEDPSASGVLRGRWWVERAWRYAGEPDSVMFQRCLARIEALAVEYGIPSLRFQALTRV
jgi:hypothetical protein